jgi:hypothetical protein
MKKAISGDETSTYLVVAPQELLTVTSRYATSMVFHTDGSLIYEFAGFDIHRTEESDFGNKITSLAGILLRSLLLSL